MGYNVLKDDPSSTFMSDTYSQINRIEKGNAFLRADLKTLLLWVPIWGPVSPWPWFLGVFYIPFINGWLDILLREAIQNRLTFISLLAIIGRTMGWQIPITVPDESFQ